MASLALVEKVAPAGPSKPVPSKRRVQRRESKRRRERRAQLVNVLTLDGQDDGRISRQETLHSIRPDRFYRVIDSLEAMFRARLFGRRDPLEAKRRYEAAKLWRHAWDTVSASVGGAMDFDRVRHKQNGAGIGESYLVAAERLRTARHRLYPADDRIITLILGEGHKLSDVVRIIRGKATKQGVEEIGSRFRYGLDVLADLWFGERKQKSHLRLWQDTGAVTVGSSAGTVTHRGRVAHASRMGVKFN